MVSVIRMHGLYNYHINWTTAMCLWNDKIFYMAGCLTPLPFCKSNVASFIDMVRFESVVLGFFWKVVSWSAWVFCFFVRFYFVSVPNLICEGSVKVTWWNLIHQLMRSCILFTVKNIFWKCINLHVWGVCIDLDLNLWCCLVFISPFFNGSPHNVSYQCDSLFPL